MTNPIKDIAGKPTELPLLLTLREAANLLKLSPRKVVMLIEDGILEAFKLKVNYRIRRDSLLKAL